MNTVRLDDLYKMTAHIYSEQNILRPTSATFSHFVEVCGMLTIHDRKKKREGVTVTDALCKALGWYFPLMAKFRVRSIEEIIFRKFPYACPYCRLAPHQDASCKLVKGTSSTVNHGDLQKVYLQNNTRRPVTLNQWQTMFQDIYPREADDRGRSTIGLLEELGELAEAIRVFDKHPKYFAGEAADTFSYLMGIANEHSLRLSQDDDIEFSFEVEFLKRYPGLCVQCGSKVCVCPSVPDATVGRMAKEIEINSNEKLFFSNPEEFGEEGGMVAHKVLEQVGGYSGLADRFPFDRGDANRALMTLCLKIADAVENEKPDFASNLRAESVRIGATATYAGSPKSHKSIGNLIETIKRLWRDLDQDRKMEITASGELVGELGNILATIRVLFVSCSPTDENSLRVSGELRVIQESLRIGDKGNHIKLDQLPAATIDDLRRKLLSESFEIIHFSGHANKEVLLFETPDGQSSRVPLVAIADLIQRYDSVKCVILNACESLKEISTPIASYTIGMADSIDDEAAIEFSRGFYDALAAGKDAKFSFDEGVSAVKLKGFDATSIQTLSSQA